MRPSVAIVMLVLTAGLAAPAVLAQSGPPADFPMPKAETSPGQVTFSHVRHLAKVTKCSLCHMRDMKMKRGGTGPFAMEAMQQGKTCGACHDGKTVLGGGAVFSLEACDRCHAM